MSTSTSYPKSGFAAFQEFISVLQPKDGDREIWLKFGHNQLFVGQWDSSGRFPIFRSRLLKENEPSSRIIEAQSVGDGYDFLDRLSRQKEGGVFFLPGQPIGSPTADAVTSTDDIGIEMDLLDYDEQRAKYQQFQEVTGLEYASLLTSGGKSIHAHLKADRHLPLEQAAYLRRLAVIAHLSDPVTVRLHQPMRIPGFFRKEKGSDQLLLATSKRRYSYDQLIAGFKKWFDFQRWAFPETLPDDFWQVIRPNLTTHKNLTEEQRAEAVKQLLVKGVEGWRQEQTEKRAALEKERAERLERSRLHAVAGVTISDLVVEASKRLGKDAFNAIDHNWQWAGTDKARGRCPFHQSSSGNSGWIGSNPDGLWAFHCYTCTDNKPIDAFAYWLYSKLGFGTPYPRGKQYIELAIEFCEQAGVSVPTEIKEWKPRSSKLATTAGQGFAVAPSLAAQARDKLIAARMRSFKDHYWGFLQTDSKLTATAKRTIRYYEGFCKQFELNAPTILIRGFLGAGKTQATLESIAERSKTAPIVWLAPRNGLLQQTIARAERMGIDCHYMQADNPLHREMLRTGQPGMYLMCPDSLKDYATGETPWYGVTVVLDEFQGQRGEVLSKAASLPEFERMMRECQCLIAADAFLGDADARIISSYRKGDRVIYDQTFTQSSTPVRWFESRTKDGKISMRHDGMVLALIRKAWSEGRKRIAVSLDNRMQILTIERLLKQDGIPVVAIESHRPDSNQLVMLSPDSYLDETLPEGVFLYSPSAQSGLDVQTLFDVVILASTGTLPPLQLLQMQGRIRRRGELWVSCPRFSENTPLSISALDGDRMKALSQKAVGLFEQIVAEGSRESWRWSAWQQTVDQIGKVFRSEYLQSLLEMFFERVTVEEIEVENRAIWQAESKRTRSLDMAEILLADLEMGMRLRHGNKSPKNRVESFAADVAKLHDKFPSAVLEAQNQIAEAGCKTPEDACMLVDLIEVMLQLNSSRMQRLYLYWLAEKGENQDIDAILNSIQTRSTNLKSAHFKRLRAICAYRELGLKKLAKLAVSDKDVLVADTNCYWSGSPEIQAMWHQFQGSPDLRRLFPEVESPDEFMNAIRSTMRALGYQSVGHRARQKSEELHANGTDRNGSKRYSRSRVVYLTGWLLMECSGNAVFQDLWASGLLEDIGDWVKRDRRFYQPIIEHSPPIAA